VGRGKGEGDGGVNRIKVLYVYIYIHTYVYIYIYIHIYEDSIIKATNAKTIKKKGEERGKLRKSNRGRGGKFDQSTHMHVCKDHNETLLYN
jgi:hypothetical protein